MQRIIAPNTVAIGAGDTAPAGTPGEATSGIPGFVAATVFPAWVWNMVQKELVAVVQAGGLTLDSANNAQVLAAIQRLIQLETGNYAPDTGPDGGHYIIAPSPAVPVLTDGLALRFLAAHTCTAGATLVVSALAAVPIVRDDGSALVAGDIPANGIASVEYNLAGNKFFLISTVQQNASAIQANLTNYAADTGADGTHFACTLSPALSAHSVGTPIRIKAAHSNTGASTFNPGPGAVAIVDPAGNPLTAGMIIAGQIITLVYDGTNYQLGYFGPATAAEVAAGLLTTKFVSPATISSRRFVSGLSGTLSTSMVYNVPHGLPSPPTEAFAFLVCQANDNGYLTGEILSAPNMSDTTTNRGVNVAFGASNVQGVVGSGGISTFPKGGGAATTLALGNWKMYLIAKI